VTLPYQNFDFVASRQVKLSRFIKFPSRNH
jgi:hypothetical protein